MLFWLSVAAFNALLVIGAPLNNTCTTPSVRSEWRELNSTQQHDYIQAVVCMMNKPSIYTDNRTQSRHADFGWLHFQMMNTVHQSASFLPWHRVFLHAYEVSLKTECNYKGFLPFWDWTVDSQAPERAPVWGDKAFGTDGDPSTDTHCLIDGPFVNYTITVPETVCISRTISQLTTYSSYYSPESVHQIISSSHNFSEFSTSLEFGPHAVVHVGVGGSMSEVIISAHDPIFYLHHANVDRIWSLWQKRYPKLANTYFGQLPDGKNVNVTDSLELLSVSNTLKDPTVSMSLSTTGSTPFCYVYSNSVRPNQSPSKSSRQLMPRSPISFKSTVQMIIAAKRIASAVDKYAYGIEQGITPKTSDRDDRKRLRCPPRIGESMSQQLKMSPEQKVENHHREDMNCAFIHFVNSNATQYQSPVSLEFTGPSMGYHSVSESEFEEEYQFVQKLHDIFGDAFKQAV
ncbi:hypothetical protein QVD99_008461 [Batrachochytrium dendrobatidis]|uniref:Tyrosinase copper-binding domain-containing protein n=1 Tax=Batrachochytrium dendrobatidis (strain JEL423) TaxID=403673 RepID=A0A177WVJ9_BATDL|nr:hypothetical protein O5D80_007333 [Batrachochytrium dendrobatidis]KAK5664923.1 hypothetical protein QVD99_008461 [Batrachochytrium dendrobatidis]OAJ43491.1 hypothetical protein BDEG_26850 [Batrachochytrium dendrobatidis JEL423]